MLGFIVTSRLASDCSLSFSFEEGSLLPTLVLRAGASSWRLSINLL